MSQPKRKRKFCIHNEQYANYSKEERSFYNELDDDDQLQIATLENTIQVTNNALVPLRFKLLQSGLDEKTMAVAIHKLDSSYASHPSSGEYQKMMHWINALCNIPFGKYQPLPVNKTSSSLEIKQFINKIKETMEQKVFGHAMAKDHIVRLLAQWISNPESKGLVIGIQGSMGTGKTTLIKDAICKVLGLPFALISLGGVSDGSFLVGHGYTYEGSTWGRVVDMLIKCKCMNPVIFFDELDKVSKTHHGEEIINILIHMTDSTQNECFQDKYFSQLEFDLSRSLVIFSYNDEDKISPILRDRMIKIKTEGYTTKDKLVIAKKHLVPGILSEFGFDKDAVDFSDDVLKQVVASVDDEQGVRNMKRGLHDIVSNINLLKLLHDTTNQECTAPPSITPTLVTADHVEKYVANTRKDKNTSHLMMYC